MYNFIILIKLPLLEKSNNSKKESNIEEYLVNFANDLEDNNKRSNRPNSTLANKSFFSFYDKLLDLNQYNQTVNKPKLRKEFVQLLDKYTFWKNYIERSFFYFLKTKIEFSHYNGMLLIPAENLFYTEMSDRITLLIWIFYTKFAYTGLSKTQWSLFEFFYHFYIWAFLDV